MAAGGFSMGARDKRILDFAWGRGAHASTQARAGVTLCCPLKAGFRPPLAVTGIHPASEGEGFSSK